MEYRSLKTLFHMDRSSERKANIERLAKQRLEAESTFRTAVNTPSGELFLAVPRELSVLNERILRHERVIAREMRSLPPVAQWAMVRGLVIEEVVSTNDLEGVYSTRRQINDILQEEARRDDPLDKKRFRELARLYLGLTGPTPTLPSTSEDVRAIYDVVMSGEPLEAHERPDGKLFRRDGVQVIGAGGKIIHEGLYPEKRIVEAVERMLAICGSEDIPETYAAIMGHFIFEYVHPFYDGNGRTGRYLLALYLSRPLSTLTSLSLSRVIAENRDAYYRSFREAEHPLNYGELTPFVLNLLNNVSMAQDDLDAEIASKKAMLDAVDSSINQFAEDNALSDRETEIVYMLAQLDLFAMFPESSLDDIAEQVGLGKQQVRVYTKSLEEKGLLKVVSRRPLRFTLSIHAAEGLGIHRGADGETII